MRVRLGKGRVPQVQDRIDLPLGHECANLEIAPRRSAADQGDVEAQPAGAELSRAARGNQVAIAEPENEVTEHVHQLVLLHVVGNQPDTRGLP